VQPSGEFGEGSALVAGEGLIAALWFVSLKTEAGGLGQEKCTASDRWAGSNEWWAASQLSWKQPTSLKTVFLPETQLTRFRLLVKLSILATLSTQVTRRRQLSAPALLTLQFRRTAPSQCSSPASE